VTADCYARAYGRMSLIYRANGQRQWAYDGDPLYTYAEDRMRGDVKGDDVEDGWHVVQMRACNSAHSCVQNYTSLICSPRWPATPHSHNQKLAGEFPGTR
jgi:Secreted repeat of unknown function